MNSKRAVTRILPALGVIIMIFVMFLVIYLAYQGEIEDLPEYAAKHTEFEFQLLSAAPEEFTSYYLIENPPQLMFSLFRDDANSPFLTYRISSSSAIYKDNARTRVDDVQGGKTSSVHPHGVYLTTTYVVEGFLQSEIKRYRNTLLTFSKTTIPDCRIMNNKNCEIGGTQHLCTDQTDLASCSTLRSEGCEWFDKCECTCEYRKLTGVNSK